MRTLSNTRPAAVGLALLAAFLAVTPGPPAGAQAPPQLPATFFGTVEVEGEPAPDGARVRAFVGGIDCTQDGAAGAFHDGGVTRYVITVVHDSQIAGCGTDGVAVSFTVDGAPARPSAAWSSRPQEVNLSASPPANTPAPAATPSPSPSFRPSTDEAGVAARAASRLLPWGALGAGLAAAAAGAALVARRKLMRKS
jgi:hypothetical protein